MKSLNDQSFWDSNGDDCNLQPMSDEEFEKLAMQAFEDFYKMVSNAKFVELHRKRGYT